MGRLDLLERLLPHVADQAELDALRVFYPLRNYVLALYHTQAQNRLDDDAVVDFVRRDRTPAVMMWWRDRDPSLSLAANGRQSRRYRPAFAAALRAAGAVTYVHSLADPAQVRRFWDLGIGVYSDEPFPPLEAGRSQLQLPDFDPDAARPPRRLPRARPRVMIAASEPEVGHGAADGLHVRVRHRGRRRRGVLEQRPGPHGGAPSRAGGERDPRGPAGPGRAGLAVGALQQPPVGVL